MYRIGLCLLSAFSSEEEGEGVYRREGIVQLLYLYLYLNLYSIFCIHTVYSSHDTPLVFTMLYLSVVYQQ